MAPSIIKASLAGYAAALCVAACGNAQAQTSPKNDPQPTGTSGATAFQPGGAARGETEASGSQNSAAGVPQAGKPGFDNKPPKGAKATCMRPQGGVDASGGENIQSSSKDNTSCTGSKSSAKAKDAAKESANGSAKAPKS